MPSAASSTFVGLPVIPPNDPSLTATTTTPRTIKKVFEAIDTPEGAGARNFSPFLMCDHFSISPGAGFPDHPHRGQETITYLLSGAVDHEDFAGHKGTIEAGGQVKANPAFSVSKERLTLCLQPPIHVGRSTGADFPPPARYRRGIVHAEMPRQNADGSANVGMQIWVDLPEKLKDCEPRYRDVKASEIPVATSADGKVSVKVISGRSLGVDSLQELAYTPVWLLDVTVRPGGSLAQPVPAAWNTWVYTLNGTTSFASGAAGAAAMRSVPRYHNVVFEQAGDTVVAAVPESADQDGRFIIVSGMPLDQKIIQYGPFVVSKQEDIYKAMFDYQTHSNGFERAAGWQSEIGKSMVH
ncbi:hypothetical protein MBLNU459_g6781t1 [Dothideomycetes sp. NU459]